MHIWIELKVTFRVGVITDDDLDLRGVQVIIQTKLATNKEVRKSLMQFLFAD